MHAASEAAQCAEEQFSDILREAPIIYSDKVRLILVDGSYMDIRYPVIDMPYRDVRTQGKLQSCFSYQSNKKEQMNQHEFSVYLSTRFGVVCPIRDFC